MSYVFVMFNELMKMLNLNHNLFDVSEAGNVFIDVAVFFTQISSLYENMA